jgi:prophage DNA circulation protein
MSLFNQLFIATYNGIEFLVDSSDMRYGRKTHTFEYPNKKYRFVEDLGENLRTFEINAIITGDDDYLIKREALILALQWKGTGVLTHPFYGMVFVAVKDYTVTENLTTLGECQFKITFEETRNNIYPVSGDIGTAFVENAINELAPYLEAFVVTQFATSFKHNTADAANKCTQLNDSLQPTKPVATDDNVLNDFNSKSIDFNTNIYKSLQDNTSLAESISDLLEAFNNLGLSSEDAYALNSSIYYFGIDDIPIKDTTAERHERILNRKILNSYVNCLILEALYANALEITYLDDQQISTKEQDLEEKYQYLMSNNVLDIDILRQLETLRNNVKKFFNKLKVNVSKIITVTVPKTPLTVLLYRYYAAFDNENEIIALNDLDNVTDISGNIQILSEVVQ